MKTGIGYVDSHANSIEALNILNRYQNFMDNINVVADMGSGYGLDALWWANLTKVDGTPRNIQVNAVDLRLEWQSLPRHNNINYIEADFSNSGLKSNSQDFLMAHNSLQFSISPIHTLLHWWDIMKPDAMLLVTLPYNFKIDNHREFQKVNATHVNGSNFNLKIFNFIMILSANGFD